ncbi:MAG: hypothetical protein KF729_32895 [Sandaracinaceae bacterium]|nr:hypothetical protein [Sandaracinaceae bacterium]
MSEPRSAAPRSEEREPAYEGAVGKTRLRSIHLTLPTGFVRLVQLYDVVDVAADPHLKEPALGGALHRFETGEALAIPFVYHDPAARKLALVVPSELRHEVLALRAKLLRELDDDRDSPVPSYAAEATTVVGTAALRAYLESKSTSAAAGELEKEKQDVLRREAALREREGALGAREAALAQREQDFAVRNEALSQREGRLHARAETVTRREDELRTLSEEVEAARADLRIQEQELEARFEMLHEREAGLIQRAESGTIGLGASSVEAAPRAPVAAPAEPAVPIAAARAGDSESAEALAQLVRDVADDVVEEVPDVLDEVEELEELDDLEPLETSPAASMADRVPSDLSSAVEMAVASLKDDVQMIEDDDDAEDDVEELDDVVPIEDVTGLHANVLPAEPTTTSSGTHATAAEPEPAGPQPTVPPPPLFARLRPGADGSVVLAPEGVRMYAKLAPGQDERFPAGATAELLVQLAVVDECPVVLLTVAEQTDGRPEVVRAALDPREDAGREVLEHLRRDCAARVSLHAATGRFLRTIEARGERERNVLRVLERVGKMRTASSVEFATAADRVLGTPPPIRAKDHPFVAPSELAAAPNAAAAKKALDTLEAWAGHDKMDRALLGLSIPADHVEGTLRHHLEQAIRFGLPFSASLREQAIALELALDPAELAAAQVQAFVETTKRPDRGGLSREDAAASFEALLAAAAEAELSIDTDTYDHAFGIIREVRGGDTAAVEPASFPKLGNDALLLLLEHPKYRRDAAIELASRKDPALADRLCKAVRKMPRNEVVRVVPKLVELGDDAGDALIDGLGARKTFVRQAFALGLGHLKLRRAVVPLLHLLAAEESEVWREVARVLGGFGQAGLRTIARQLKDPKAPRERYILTLAHLANHGCDKQVDKLTKEERASVAAMAVEALTLRQEARTVDDRARGDKKLPSRDPVLEFSRRFYAEVEGRAPEGDLEE